MNLHPILLNSRPDMIRYVTQLEQCEARRMHVAQPLPDNRHVLLNVPRPWQKLPIVGLAAMETTDELENGYRKYTTKLTVVLHEPPPQAAEPLAYRATFADGAQAIIGLNYAPYPLATIDDGHPNTASDKAACTLTVTWAAPTPPLLTI